jgi:hypothetical protein
MSRATEDDIAQCVARIAKGRPDKLCTFARAKSQIPGMIHLTKGDLELSTVRRGEPMWHQLIRNIKSHDSADGNWIDRGLLEHSPRKGYFVTAKGEKYLASKGY